MHIAFKVCHNIPMPYGPLSSFTFHSASGRESWTWTHHVILKAKEDWCNMTSIILPSFYLCHMPHTPHAFIAIYPLDLFQQWAFAAPSPWALLNYIWPQHFSSSWNLTKPIVRTSNSTYNKKCFTLGFFIGSSYIENRENYFCCSCYGIYLDQPVNPLHT